MNQRECAGYIITQSIRVKDAEFVLGEHPKKDISETAFSKRQVKISRKEGEILHLSSHDSSS